jgi:hypothetical protein
MYTRVLQGLSHLQNVRGDEYAGPSATQGGAVDGGAFFKDEWMQECRQLLARAHSSTATSHSDGYLNGDLRESPLDSQTIEDIMGLYESPFEKLREVLMELASVYNLNTHTKIPMNSLEAVIASWRRVDGSIREIIREVESTRNMSAQLADSSESVEQLQVYMSLSFDIRRILFKITVL